MDNYEKMYFVLFNAITDALNEIENHNFGNATIILKEAQMNCEDVYIGEH